MSLPAGGFRNASVAQTRALVSVDAADGVLTTVDAQSLTLARAGAAVAHDAAGVLYPVVHSQPRIAMWDSDGDGTPDAPYLLLERSATNLVAASENLSDNTAGRWARTGSPTFGTAHTSSGIALDLLGDDDGASAEDVHQDLSFTGAAKKALLLRVKKGTSPAAGGSRIQLRDTTAGADRLNAVLTWSGTAPSVALSAGTLLATTRRYDDTYDLLFQTGTAIVTGNTNRLSLIPAATAGQTGNVYVGGVHAENALVAGSYIKNATAGGGTRAGETLSRAFSARPRAMTLYVQGIELGAVRESGQYVLTVASAGQTNAWCSIDVTSTGYQARHHNGTAAVASALSSLPSVGALLELRAVLNADGSVQMGQSVDGAAETLATASSANALAGVWGDGSASVWLGGVTAALTGLLGLRRVVIADGAQSLATLRTLR